MIGKVRQLSRLIAERNDRTDGPREGDVEASYEVFLKTGGYRAGRAEGGTVYGRPIYRCENGPRLRQHFGRKETESAFKAGRQPLSIICLPRVSHHVMVTIGTTLRTIRRPPE